MNVTGIFIFSLPSFAASHAAMPRAGHDDDVDLGSGEKKGRKKTN